MKHASLIAVLLVFALAATAIGLVPSYVDAWVETPTGWKRQREAMHQNAVETVKKFEARHGETPLEQWPELDRQTYANAKRILGEMYGNP
jgi:hypothetical protein